MTNRNTLFATILSVLICFGLVSRAQAAEGDIGGGNTVEGFHALNNSTVTGGFNSGFGWYAGGFMTTGQFNTAAGAGALDVNITGNSNSAFGTGALLLNVGHHADDNTAVGTNALLHNSFSNTSPATATENTGVGFMALYSNMDGGANTAVGSGALESNLASANTAVGAGALSDNTTAVDNTAIGIAALTNNHTAPDNTAIGAYALAANDSDKSGVGEANTALGSEALNDNVRGKRNTAVGAFALLHNDTTNNAMGNRNTAVGTGSLFNNTDGAQNTAVGDDALLGNDVGVNNTALGFKAADAAIGSLSSLNTVVGALAGSNDSGPGITTGFGNVVVGAQAGQHIQAGSGNVYIGSHVDPLMGESFTIRINDGFAPAPGASASGCFIANIAGKTTGPPANSASVFIDLITGQLGTVASSERYKKDIAPMGKSSEVIYSLNPVTFHYKGDEANTPEWGLIAEEVAKVNPALAAVEKDGKPMTVRYEQINAMLLNEFLKEHKAFVEEHRTVEELKKQVAALTAGLQKVSAQLEVSKRAPQVVVNKP